VWSANCGAPHYAIQNIHTNNLVGKPKRKTPFRRPRCRREDNIKITTKGVVCDSVDWIQAAQDLVHSWAFLKWY
jgi:hypothetical protein